MVQGWDEAEGVFQKPHGKERKVSYLCFFFEKPSLAVLGR